MEVIWIKRPVLAHDSREIYDVSGKTILITGTTTGIGLDLAKRLCSLGAHLILAVRRVAYAQKQVSSDFSNPSNVLAILEIDLTDLTSVTAFCQEYAKRNLPKLDVLILNAGMSAPVETHSKQGLDRVFTVNYLSNVLLVDTLIQQGSFPTEIGTDGFVPRVISVASEMHRMADPQFDIAKLGQPHPVTNIGSFLDYANSKSYLVSWTAELQRRRGPRIACISMCPGGVLTSVGDEYSWFVRKIGVSLLSIVATTPDVAQEYITRLVRIPAQGFMYFSKLNRKDPSTLALDQEQGRVLWDASHDLIQSKLKLI